MKIQRNITVFLYVLGLFVDLGTYKHTSTYCYLRATPDRHMNTEIETEMKSDKLNRFRERMRAQGNNRYLCTFLNALERSQNPGTHKLDSTKVVSCFLNTTPDQDMMNIEEK